MCACKPALHVQRVNVHEVLVSFTINKCNFCDGSVLHASEEYKRSFNCIVSLAFFSSIASWNPSKCSDISAVRTVLVVSRNIEDSFRTVTVRFCLGPTLPNLWGELSGECLLHLRCCRMDFGSGIPVVTGWHVALSWVTLVVALLIVSEVLFDT